MVCSTIMAMYIWDFTLNHLETTEMEYEGFLFIRPGGHPAL